MLGVKLWYTPGRTGCDRCGRQAPLASPGWFSGQLWCSRCLTTPTPALSKGQSDMDKITPYLKALAALVGAVATALLGIYGPDTDMGRILTVAAAVATAVTTWAVPNLDPKAQHQDESVQPPSGR